MVSGFRRFVSSLVLISYFKLLVTSSFAWPGSGTPDITSQGLSLLPQIEMSSPHFKREEIHFDGNVSFKPEYYTPETLGQIELNAGGELLTIDFGSQDYVVDREYDFSAFKRVLIRGVKTIKFLHKFRAITLTLENLQLAEVLGELDLKGDLTTPGVGVLKVGQDNDHLGIIRSQGAVDVETQTLVDARFGIIEGRVKNSLNAAEGKVILGERVVVPASEVRSKISSNANDLLGFGPNAPSCVDFYVPNKSRLYCSNGPIVLKSGEAVIGNFGTLIARNGLEVVSPLCDFLNVNKAVYGTTRIQTHQYIFGRTENVLQSYYFNGLAQDSLVQTSYPPKFLSFGDVYLEARVAKFLGSDLYVTGSFFLNGAKISDAGELKNTLNISAFSHYHASQTRTWQEKKERHYFHYKTNCIEVISSGKSRSIDGFSGGVVAVGKSFSVELAGQIISSGGDVSAQRVTLNANSALLEGLAALQRHESTTMVSLLPEATRLHRQFSGGTAGQGTMTLFGGGALDMVRSQIPVYDPLTHRVTLGLPRGATLSMDPFLEQLAFVIRMQECLGRLYDDRGRSGVEAYQAAFGQGVQLAKQGRLISPDSLGKIRTPLLTYQEHQVGGKRSVVPHVYFPQTKPQDFLQVSGRFRGEEVKIDIQGLLENMSGIIAGYDSCEVLSGDNYSATAVYRVITSDGFEEVARERAQYLCENGVLVIKTKKRNGSQGSMTMKGVHLEGRRGVDADSEGERFFGPAELKRRLEENRKGFHRVLEEIRNIRTTIKAGDASDATDRSMVTVHSDGNSIDQGVVTHATGDVKTRSEGDHQVLAAQDQTSEKVQSKKKSGAGKTKKLDTTGARATALVDEKTSEHGNVEISSKGDLTLQANKVRAREGKITLESDEGFINLLHAMNYLLFSSKKSSEDMAWKSESSYFGLHEDVQICQLEHGQGIEFKTNEGIRIELGVKKTSTLDGKKNKGKPMTSEELKSYVGPGYEWVAELANRDDVIRIYVDEQHHVGRVATQGLTAAAKIVVAIAVTLATGGAGGNLCMSVGQTVAGGLQLSGLAASVVTSVVAGATSTLITKATVSIIDHRGNVVETGKEFADAQVWEDLAKDAAITAIVGASPYGGESFTSRLMNHALRSLVTAGADMACGEKARDALRRAGINFLVNVVQSEVARQIGGWRKEALDQKDEFGKPVTLESDVMNYVMHKAMHAALAGAIQASSAALQGADREAILKAVAGGAIGAAVAEVVAEFLKDEVMERIEERTKAETAGLSGKDLNDARGKIKSEELTRLTTLAQLAATSTVFLSRYDVAAASAAAVNAVENNGCMVMDKLVDDLFDKMDAEAAEKSVQNLVNGGAQKLSPEEIKQRFGERVRAYRDVLAFEGDRGECIQNWIDDVFENQPPSPRTRSRVENEWGKVYDKMSMSRHGFENSRQMRCERDAERGEGYFVEQRIKEFAKDDGISPEEADRRYRSAAERSYSSFQEQMTAGMIGGALTFVAGNRAMPKTSGVMRDGSAVEQAANRPSVRAGIPESEAKNVYNPHQWREAFEARYGKDAVSSTTLQKPGTPGYNMAGKRHPVSEIVYDLRGNPNFEKYTKYDTMLEPEQFYGKNRPYHMRAATRDLREKIAEGKVAASRYSSNQIGDIKAGKAKIDGLTWHHDQQARRMQLVDSQRHGDTGHVGSVSLEKGNQ